MSRKTVVFLCGFIGSGKTTYAKKNYEVITDLDYMPPQSTKIDQINLTRELLKEHDAVCHITCFPTLTEARSFNEFNQEFLWMDTTIQQSRINILKRKRRRDLTDLNRVFKANLDYLKKIQRSSSTFKMIKNYGEGESNG